MYCSSCGTENPDGRTTCMACGSPMGWRQGGPSAVTNGRGTSARHVPVCPRCGYEGTGITYFSRGGHVAALVAATVVTAGMMGAGGIVYYLMRRDYRVCPRCGRGWGRFGETAAAVTQREQAPAEIAPGRERAKRGWSIALFLFAALFTVIGFGAGEAVPIVMAALAAAGGVALQRSANGDRELRRAQLVTSLQLPVLKLAAERGGHLTVTQVAAELGWPLRRAEKILHSLDDGLRVDSEVTDEGVIVYQFRELRGPGNEPPRLMG